MCGCHIRHDRNSLGPAVRRPTPCETPQGLQVPLLGVIHHDQSAAHPEVADQPDDVSERPKEWAGEDLHGI